MTSSSFPRRVAVLGSTGSIGRKAVAVAERYPERLRVVSLAAYRSTDELAAQGSRLGVDSVVVGDPTQQDALATKVPAGVNVGAGPGAVAALAAAPDVDLVVNAVVGRAGLEASFAAVAEGKRLALANKESLVLAGELLMETARENGATVLPVDSEHSGLFQCLEGREKDDVRRLVITASGGPFRGRSRAELERVTPAEALEHPVWPMGPRITVDSATLFNKGLEVIETHHLFGTPLDAIGVWVHPQSVIHAFVELTDGSLIAQLSAPDMMMPVQYAMSHPERWEASAPECRLPDWGALGFEMPDLETFPAITVAVQAARKGGTSPAALNAADEVAVEAFLANEIPFLAVTDVVQEVVETVESRPATSLEAIIDADREAREVARALLEARTR